MFDKILMGAAGASGGISYDYFFLTGLIDQKKQTLSVNSLSNLDVISGIYEGIFLNTNDAGIQYSKKYQENSADVNFFGKFVDSSDNIYVLGNTTVSDRELFYAKLDSSGSQLGGKKYTTSTTGHSNFAADIKQDSSGNLYLGCFTSRTGLKRSASLIKINSSGTILWQKTFTYSTTDVYIRSITVDSNDNVIVLLQVGSPIGAEVIKFNSSGTLQWSYRFANNYSFYPNGGLDTDSNDNIYFAGSGGYQLASNRRNTVIKLNSSGTIQWHSTSYSYSSQAQYVYDLHVSSEDKLYFCGNYYNYNAFDSHAHWTELNTSTGAVNLARWCKFSNTNYHAFFGIRTDDDGNIVVAGFRNTSTTTEMNVARFPSDGSLTGTYSTHNDNLTYAAVSPLTTDSTALLSSSSAILTISTGSYTASSLSLSSSNTSNSVTTTILT